MSATGKPSATPSPSTPPPDPRPHPSRLRCAAPGAVACHSPLIRINDVSRESTAVSSIEAPPPVRNGAPVRPRYVAVTRVVIGRRGVTVVRPVMLAQRLRNPPTRFVLRSRSPCHRSYPQGLPHTHSHIIITIHSFGDEGRISPQLAPTDGAVVPIRMSVNREHPPLVHDMRWSRQSSAMDHEGVILREAEGRRPELPGARPLRWGDAGEGGRGAKGVQFYPCAHVNARPPACARPTKRKAISVP
jgi:hypothetical protein